ncbi:MAG: SRPBCC family protein [Verrucomicrobiota bacterium]|nr:SRPBCC family protein [Verrucomicrobiota bacterium]
MHACNTIQIRAPRETIFATVRDLERWPEILPHYRSVQFLKRSGERHVVEMAARRSAIPISWTSEFWTDEKHLELHFLHLEKWTRGMKVVWTMTPTRDGTRVEIVHSLEFRVPLLSWLAEPIIGRFFIHHIAGKTLQGFKAYLENGPSLTANP